MVSILALSAIASRCQIPPFVAADIFPRPGEVGPQGDAFWGNAVKFSATAKAVPLGKVDCRAAARRKGFSLTSIPFPGL